MSLRQENIVGIDIGTEKIKIVRGGNGAITRAGWAKVPEGVIKQSRVESKEMLVAAIKEAKKAARIGNGPCALGVSGTDTIIRHIQLPKMNPAQIYQNVLSEISGYMPVNPDRYNIDYRIQEVTGSGDNEQYRVMVVAVPRDNVAAYVECLRMAGLKVKYADVLENAYEKFIAFLRAKGNIRAQCYFVIDLGATKTNVSVYKNGSFFVNMLINTGFEKLVQQLKEKASAEKVTVDQILSVPRDLNDKEWLDEAGQHITKYLDDIVTDMAKVFDFYRSRNAQNPIEAVYLAGGLSALPGVGYYLSSKLKLPVTELSQLSGFMFKRSFPQYATADYCGAIGVTFREVSKK